MSRLYGSLDADASRTTASRRAHKWITGHVRGWGSGIRVAGDVADGADRFMVYATGGSHAAGSDRLLGELVDGVWRPADD